MKTVYYHPWLRWHGADKQEDPLDNPLFMDDVFIPPTTYKEYLQNINWWEGHEFATCPAVTQYVTNTFVFYSQVPLHFKLSEEEGSSQVELLLTPEENQSFHTVVLDDEVIDDKLVMQFSPRYLMWTPDKDVWLEEISMGNPIVPGMFPLSKWPRSINQTSLSTRGQEIKINRGDPVFAIRFPDGGEKYKLVKKRPTEAESLEQERSVQLKEFLPKFSWPLAINRKEKKKCPFRKFW